MSTHILAASSLIGLALLTISGCRKARPVQPPAPSTTIQVTDDGARRDSLARAEGLRRDSLAREERLRTEREQRLTAARATLVQPIHFGFDRAELTPESQRTLDAKLPLLAASLDVRLRIGGHADERGSDEYNLALGQRRAVSAKRYLSDHGIDPSRIDVVSYGEERPICTTAQEECWARNRRAEFEIVAGGDRIVVQ